MVEQYGLKTCLHLRQPMTIDCVNQSNDLIQMYQEIFMVDWTQSTLSLTYFLNIWQELVGIKLWKWLNHLST